MDENMNVNLNENETEVENDEMAVVVPKSDLIEMPKAAAQTFDAHLSSFASFYIKKFKTDNLEVMESFDAHKSMMELNKYILNNISLPRRDLAQKTLETHPTNFETLVADIAEKSDVNVNNFTSFTQWAEWYETIRAEGKTALS